VTKEAKTNDITAITQLLALLHLQGCIDTIDVIGCRSAINEKIIAQDGDYLSAPVGDQETLARGVQGAFIDADAREHTKVDLQMLHDARKYWRSRRKAQTTVYTGTFFTARSSL
jgi:predicted transposase YbfD/YdcC